jgi:proton-translocating NADH-quinone oxidoreductase chain N
MVAASLILSPVVYITGRRFAASAQYFALAALAIIWLIFGLAVRNLTAEGALLYTQGLISFYFDGLSLLITALVLLLGTLAVLYSGPDIRGLAGVEKYYALVLMMIGAVIGLVSAGDLFNLWVWFEMTAVSSYLLVAFYREQSEALAACVKYLIQTATGSILVLFGIALIFAQTGALDLAHMVPTATPLTLAAGTLFIIGFGVKIAMVPTYTWLPDAYAQAPTGISALLSGVVTITGLIVLLRVLGLLVGLAVEWGAVLIAFSTLNIVIGNLLALRQQEVKRILAYSSISHIGYVLLAVGIGIYTQQPMGFQGGMLHLWTHGLMKALAFLAVGTALYTRVHAAGPLRVRDLRGMAGRDPVTAFALVVACLSLAGIPPLAGFMSKWQIFAAGVQADNGPLLALTAFAGLNSVFSLAYYFPIINALYQDSGSSIERSLPVIMRVPVILLTAAVILVGIYPGILDSLVVPASQTLMKLFGG